MPYKNKKRHLGKHNIKAIYSLNGVRDALRIILFLLYISDNYDFVKWNYILGHFKIIAHN